MGVYRPLLPKHLNSTSHCRSMFRSLVDLIRDIIGGLHRYAAAADLAAGSPDWGLDSGISLN